MGATERPGPAAVLATLIAVLFAACDPGIDVADDAGTDADTDADSDADGDGDADGDSDSDADADADGDTCPDLDYQAIDVAAGTWHTCAVLEGGGVKCWGSNQFGMLGYPVDENPCTGLTPDTCPLVDVGAPVLQITAGVYHTCALLEGGDVKCWGHAGGGGADVCYEMLGPGAEVPGWGFVDDPSTIGALDLGTTVEQLSTSAGHSSVRTADGEVIVWGCWGLLGYPEGESGTQPEFGGTAIQVSTGDAHHCVLVEGGDVYCWGYNEYGQLGYGHTEFVWADEIPGGAGPVDLGGPAVQVSAGGFHTCAILEGGDVVCWGKGLNGRLGYGNSENIGNDEVPADAGTIDLGGQAVQISTGRSHTCAILDGGTLKCWGGILFGMGETIGDDVVPGDVGPISIGGPVVRVAGGSGYACALLASGRIRCWGENDAGELGYGHTEYIGDDEVPAAACDVPVM
jgi:alpha-tubulin suppressor-like RCC1 family protein